MPANSELRNALATAPAMLPADGWLAGLAFPAALVDGDGMVRAASAPWLADHPEAGAGTRLASWWAENHPSGGDAAADLERILARGKGAVAHEYASGDELRRVVIAAYPGGALITEHRLGPACDPDPQAQKMEAIGRLAGGVAHDFANLLTLIVGYSEMLLGRIGAKDPTRPGMEEIRSAADRGARLTGQLLGFLRGEAAQPRPLDLNAIVRDMQEMLRPIIGERVEMTADLAGDLEPVMADAGQMEQILLNLILNARDAMPQGGLVAIATSNCRMNEAAAAQHGVWPGNYVLLSVSDTGAGIPADAMGHIFEPFFTTKEPHKGTGLGLSTVYGIVKRAGGDIWVNSLPGCGSVFTLCLPNLASHAPADVPGFGESGLRHSGAPQPAGVMVLLVEDEEGVRSVLAKVLRRDGYQVLEASDGIEGLRIFEERGREIRLVLTDLVMPRMNGWELTERLRGLRPDLKVIHMSGYTDPGPATAAASASGAPMGLDDRAFLQKPVRPAELTATVRAALDSPVQPFNPS